MLEIIDSNSLWHLFEDDPVRPHLTGNFRTSPGRDALLLWNEDQTKPRAVICVAYTNSVPQNEQQLDLYSQAAAQENAPAHIAVFYTVWSYDRGAGREIVFAAQDFTARARGCTRWVTLSPLTEMAERFHIKNGAVLIERGTIAQNFEYLL